MVVAVIFIGPKELPAVVRAMAKAVRGMRKLAGDMRRAFDDLGQEAGLKDAADAINADMRLIKGDDGKLYESYDLSRLPGNAKRGQ